MLREAYTHVLASEELLRLSVRSRGNLRPSSTHRIKTRGEDRSSWWQGTASDQAGGRLGLCGSSKCSTLHVSFGASSTWKLEVEMGEENGLKHTGSQAVSGGDGL